MLIRSTLPDINPGPIDGHNMRNENSSQSKVTKVVCLFVCVHLRNLNMNVLKEIIHKYQLTNNQAQKINLILRFYIEIKVNM